MKRMWFIMVMLLGLQLGQAPSARAEDAAPVVVATIAPIAMLAELALGEGAAVTTLLDGNISPHEFVLTPSMVRTLSNADYIIWAGPRVETALAGKLEHLAPRARLISLANDEDGNAHFWLSPMRAHQATDKIASAMGLANVQADMFTALISQISTALSDVGHAPFIVMHDAYGAFEDAFGMTPLAIIGVDHDVPLSARRVAQTRYLIRQNSGLCVFVEPQFHIDELAPIVGDTDARLATLDPLGTDVPIGPRRYQRFMLRFAAQMKACLAP